MLLLEINMFVLENSMLLLEINMLVLGKVCCYWRLICFNGEKYIGIGV